LKPEIGVTEIVGDDDHDVGFSAFAGCRNEQRGGEQSREHAISPVGEAMGTASL
jgi:hypothetical protein